MTTTNRESDTVIDQRVTAERDDDIVVFHIGMRINALWKLHRWLPVFVVAPLMVRELIRDDDSGLLDSRTVVGPGIRHVGFVQYWSSFDGLREYAHAGDSRHLPAWQRYSRDGANDTVGIWHETYVVAADDFEAVYNNMPAHGLAACEGSEVVDATDRRQTAAGRLGRSNGSDDPLDGG